MTIDELGQYGIGLFRTRDGRVWYTESAIPGLRTAKAGEITDPSSLGIDVNSIPQSTSSAEDSQFFAGVGGTTGSNYSNLDQLISERQNSYAIQKRIQEQDASSTYTHENVVGPPLTPTTATPQGGTGGYYKVQVPVTASNPGGYDVYDAQGNHLTLDQTRTLGPGGGPLNLDALPVSGTGGISSPGGLQSVPGGTGIDLSGLPPEWRALYTRLDSMLADLTKRGQIINPNVQITPDKLAEFATLAHGQIEPYYASQLKVAKDQFLTGLGYSNEQIQNQEKQYAQQYKQSLRNIGEQSAETGFALSGRRQLQEQQLAENTQNEINQNRRQLSYNAGNEASKFAQTYGYGNVPTAPTFTPAPRVLPGQESFSFDQTSPFYQLSNDVYSGLIGSQQNEQKQAEGTLARTLATDYTTGLANNQLRTLTL